jgi:hypothetical protein
MREGDLADLVIPLLSVDEFVSDVDPTQCIAFGFYVHDQDAANDLNRFLQKSATPIMDTKVSPAPDQHGYYMVFAELMNNSRLPEIMTEILAEIKGLVDIEDWQMRVRKTKGLVPFSEENLKRALKKIDDDDVHENIMTFLHPSMLSNVLFEDDLIMLEGGGEKHLYNVIMFDRIDAIMEKQKLAESPMAFDIRTIARLNRVRRSLGEDWEASRIGPFVMLHNGSDPRGLLLRI